MVPPGTATARQVAAARPGRQPGREAARPPLRVVPKKGQGAAQGRLATYLAVALVVVALLVVVVGQAMLANGQVRLTAVEQKLVAEQATHRQIELQVANLQQPSRIVGEATGPAMHMVISGIPVQLQHVSLTTPLATPTVTPVPAAPASTAPTAAK